MRVSGITVAVRRAENGGCVERGVLDAMRTVTGLQRTELGPKESQIRWGPG